MKLHFESDLDFQRDAIDAVADLFEGQSTGDSPFSVRLADENALPGFAVAGGTANELRLNESALESNAWKVQKRNGLLCSDPATVRSRQFSIEMETGSTGRVPDPMKNTDFVEAMKMAEDIKATLLGVREEQREERKKAKEPKAAVICPYCGATTKPDASGCCEYCGGPLG